jgi:pimeloyl-ACP methyl ester carboxylesterase
VIEEPPVLPLFVSRPPHPAELPRHFATRPRPAVAILRFGAGTSAPGQKAFQRGEDDKAMLTFGHGVLGKESFERLPEARMEEMRENLSAPRAQMLGAGFPPPGDDEVRGIRAAVLLVAGERSPSVLLRLTDRLEGLLPIVERVEIPGASYVMHEDNAAALNEAVAGFLRVDRDGPTPTRARHGGRAEKNKHGVDTVGLLMEAEFGQVGRMI